MSTPLPAGFTCHVANIGIKDDTDDFVVLAASRPVAAAGVFTRSLFAGPSVLVLADGPGRRLEAAALASSASDTPWEALMLAVDFKGGTVREYAEGST